VRAYLVKFSGVRTLGQVLPPIEEVVVAPYDNFHPGITPGLVAAIEAALLKRRRPLGWESVEIEAIRRFAGATVLDAVPGPGGQ
jgi:hypothetical protein